MFGFPNIRMALIGGGVALVAGFAACEAYEHSAPWGLSHKLQDARADAVKGWAQVDGWKANRKGWVDYAHTLEAKAAARNTSEASRVEQCSRSADTDSHAAWTLGFSAGKLAGARTTGAPDAPLCPRLGDSIVADGRVLNPQVDPIFGPDRAYRPAGPLRAHR